MPKFARVALSVVMLGPVFALMGGCPGNSGGGGGTAGPQGPQGPAGAMGDTGAMGLPGADGQLRVYGDGSAGARVIAADDSWLTGMNPPSNIQFSDFTINAGVQLVVPSGTVIRCTGTFTNNGTITVTPGAFGGQRAGYNSSTYEDTVIPAQPGVTRQSAGAGAVGTGGNSIQGGNGAAGLEQLQARELVLPGTFGGGGGGSAMGLGGTGGGSFVVIAKGPIANGGSINASGFGGGILFAGGGGGGGFVVLASKTSVNNGGTITANGGPGSNGGTTSLACAGGGGGIIHFIAPILNVGITNVLGGTAGTTGPNLTANPRSGGGGGGACGGNGGTGDHTADGMTPAGNQQNGGDGYILSSTADPSALF